MEELIARPHADYEALTRFYERAREAESAATARATALAADLAAARSTLATEQHRLREADRALAEKNTIAENARKRADELMRDWERLQNEMRSMRDSPAARDTTIVQMRHSLDERDTQLAALQQEHAKAVLALEAFAETGARPETESAAAARVTVLAADLAAARSALATEQHRLREANGALAEKNTIAENARKRSDELMRDWERLQNEMRSMRDSLAARDTTIVKVRRSLDERDTQLTALQQEYAKVVPELEARAENAEQLEADLHAALARADATSLELKAGQDAAAVLNAQLKRSESRLNAALTELGAVKTQSSSYLELLRTREWRCGFDQNLFHELAARVDAANVARGKLQAERDQEYAKVVPELEARAENAEQLEADLHAALARADATSLELRVGQDAAAVLNAQLKRSESRLNAALTELGAVKTQSSSYLELLRTREWRYGFDQNMFHELAARVDAADVAHGELQAERDHWHTQVKSLQRKLEIQDALVEKAESVANADSKRAAELHAAAQLRESDRAAQFAQLVPDPETREQESTALMEDSVAVGDVLMGRYRLVALIGEGDMSRVYKATDLGATTRVSPDSFIAVKVLTRPIDEGYVSFSSFQKLRGLAHPNIARIFDCDWAGSTVFIAMEYFADPSLRTKLHRGATAGTPPSGLDRDEARSIILGIADALDYAHRNDVVHGDLKPGNVIVIDRSQIKVIDFEIASWLAPPRTALQRREAALQRTSPAPAPRYASPQLVARQKPEPADDIYALACLAYELLTGIHPFDAGAGAQSLKFPPPRRAELSSAQYSALVHALQRDRSKRTPTVRQFVAEFSAPERGGALKPRAIAPAMALGAAVFLLAVVAWFFAHRAPVPTQVPAASSPAVPKPGTVIRDCPTCPAMTILPAGRFTQGSARVESISASFEKPPHWVIIRRPFAMSTNVVTVDDFKQFVAATGRDVQGCDTYDGKWKLRSKNSWRNPGFMQTGTHPVTCASWNDAEAYARWLSTKTGRRYRLPSASEWEYAARAGGEAVQPWSRDGSGACANANVADESAAHEYPGWVVFACDDGYVHTAPVGSFKANPFGLNDMLGNVFQWTEDCWHANYTGAPIDGSARTDGDCSEHELRGGSWFSTPAYVRADYRNHFAADYRTSSVGIRLVREIEQ